MRLISKSRRLCAISSLFFAVGGALGGSPSTGVAAEPPTIPLLEEDGQSVTSPVNVLDGVHAVAMSPDGRHLYAAVFHDDAIVVFGREPGSGLLNYSGVSTGNHLDGAQGVVVSPDGEQVYAVSGIAGTLTVFDRDPVSGTLTLMEEFSAANLQWLAGAFGVAVSPNGRFVYVSSLIESAVIGFERLTDDSLVFRSVNSDLSNPNLVQTRDLTISPDGKHLYVTAEDAGHSGSGNVVVYEINTSTGAITEIQWLYEGMLVGSPFSIELDALGGVRDVVVSPDGAHVYVVAGLDATVVIFRRDAATGEITYRRQVRDGEQGVDGLDGASGVAITPDGRYVVAAAFDDDSVAVFGRDQDYGYLNQVQTVWQGSLPPYSPRLNGARDIVVSGDGLSVYVGAFVDDAVVGLRVSGVFGDGFESGSTAAWSGPAQ